MDLEFFVGNSVRPGSKNKNGQSKKSKEITYIFTKYIKVWNFQSDIFDSLSSFNLHKSIYTLAHLKRHKIPNKNDY